MSYHRCIVLGGVVCVLFSGLVFADDATSTPGTDGPAGTPDQIGATIQTGDATTDASTTNDLNTNVVADTGAASTTVEASNDATTTSTTTSESATGSNTADGGGGAASVTSGNAIATGEVINAVNTNIVDSNGLILFLNLLFGGGLDLRSLDLSYFFGGSSSTPDCSLSGCGSLAFTGSNTASIGNDMIVRADTSSNSASSTNDASVNSGNAYAVASVLNLINSNFIKSNYLLVSFNSFGDTAGDIVLPTADFFSKLFAQGGALPADTTVSAMNSALVDGMASTTADTGGNNAASTNGTSTVTTGQAFAGSSTFNAVNQNLVGGTSVFLLFRVWGDWTGMIQGLPEGITWAQTPMGVELFGSGSAGGGQSGSGSPLASLSASTTNAATVHNDVQVWALTGDNEATSASGTASVSSGNAYAAANVVNFVNTNVIGRNWIFAIFNIFGNWSGNIAFGQPNLWVGSSVDTPNPTRSGSIVTYHVTVKNRGDATATGVRLSARDPQGLIIFSDTSSDGSGSWDIGTLPAGEERTLSYQARVAMVPAGALVSVPLSTTVTSIEHDAVAADNTDQVALVVADVGNVSGAPAGLYTADPKITISVSPSEHATTTGTVEPYSIVVKNDGGAAYQASISDTLTDPSGATVYSRSWRLGTVKQGEEARVNYTVAFGKDIAPGTYTNTARITGRRNNSSDAYATDMQSLATTTQIQIVTALQAPVPQVLGAATSTSCEPVVISRISPTGKNSASDVQGVQVFLNAHAGADVPVSGMYDATTAAAVRKFQEAHMSEILSPWGLAHGTGVVGATTARVINAIACGQAPTPLGASEIRQLTGVSIGGTVSASVSARTTGGSTANASVRTSVRGASSMKGMVSGIVRSASHATTSTQAASVPRLSPPSVPVTGLFGSIRSLLGL